MHDDLPQICPPKSTRIHHYIALDSQAPRPTFVEFEHAFDADETATVPYQSRDHNTRYSREPSGSPLHRERGVTYEPAFLHNLRRIDNRILNLHASLKSID